MLVDLTSSFKQTFEKFKDNKQSLQIKQESIGNSSALHANTRLYLTFSSDIHSSLMKISQTLCQSQQNYFSNASYSYQAYTDRQRSQFDKFTRQNLENVGNQIKSLKEGLAIAMFKNQTSQHHMKNIVLCLYQLFKEISNHFQKFLEFSEKKKKKILNTISIDSKKNFEQNTKTKFKSSQIIDEQTQKEAHLIYMEKVAQQKSIQQTKKSLESLTQVLHKMSNTVLQQQLLTSSFMSIGQTGLFHIKKGTENVRQANYLAKQTGKWWSYLFLSMAFSLLLMDYIKS